MLHDNRAEWRKKLGNVMEGHIMHWVIGTLVVANAAILGLETFQDPAEWQRSWLYIINDIIILIFAIEISLKIIALGKEFFKDGWHVFDFLVVFVSILPLREGLEAIRSLRVLRLLALIEFSPKLRHIVRALWHSIPGVINVAFILVLLYYSASIMAVFFFRAEGVPGFENLGQSMMTLFQVLTGDNWSHILYELQRVFPYAWIFFYVYYVMMVFVVLNLFIGVVVNALQTAERELFLDGKSEHDQIREDLSQIKRELSYIKRKLK